MAPIKSKRLHPAEQFAQKESLSLIARTKKMTANIGSTQVYEAV